MENNSDKFDRNRCYKNYIDKMNARLNGEVENNLGAFASNVNRNQNHLDEKGSASRYLDSVLLALKPGMTYRDTKGTPYMPFVKGANLGTIYSWVVDQSGQLWWQIDNKGPFANRFVKSEPGLFSGIIAEKTSSGKKIEDERAAAALAESKKPINVLIGGATGIVSGVGDALSGVGKTLGGLGRNFGVVVGVVVVIALVVAFSKLKNA